MQEVHSGSLAAPRRWADRKKTCNEIIRQDYKPVNGWGMSFNLVRDPMIILGGKKKKRKKCGTHVSHSQAVNFIHMEIIKLRYNNQTILDAAA